MGDASDRPDLHPPDRRCLESDPSGSLRRCLAIARDWGVTSWELAEDETRDSIVRSPDHRARSSTVRNTKGAQDVLISGLKKSAESMDVEVVLGVDTHLDFHMAVALDDLGMRLGESTVPTTTQGYERLVCWAEEFGVVKCGGVEGTSSNRSKPCESMLPVKATRCSKTK
jgi:hypothetical protein